MKRLFIAFSLFVFSISCKSTTIPLDSIKLGLVAFVKDVERHNFTIDDFPNFLISNKDGEIEEGKEGIFLLGVQVIISSGAREHFLLVEKNSFQILNMREPIDINVKKLLQFFERNSQYSKEDVLFYIRVLVNVHQQNEKYMSQFKGVVM